MSLELLVPDIGDFEQVEIIEVLVKKGDNLKKNDPVVTLESDKSSVEVPSTVEGKISNINVKVGDKVSKGDLILEVEGNGKVSPDEIPKSTKNLIEEAEKTIHKEIKHAQETEIQKEIKDTSQPQIQKETIKIAEDRISNVVKDGDIDPLVKPKNAFHANKLIANSELLMIENMGHLIEEPVFNKFKVQLIQHLDKNC